MALVARTINPNVALVAQVMLYCATWAFFIWEIMVDFNLDIDADLKNLDKFIRELEKDVWDVTRAAAFKVEAGGKKRVRRDTGHLAGTITVFDMDRDKLEARVGTNATYAKAQEYGPSPENPHKWGFTPYLNPALEAERRPFIEALKQVLKRGES